MIGPLPIFAFVILMIVGIGIAVLAGIGIVFWIMRRQFFPDARNLQGYESAEATITRNWQTAWRIKGKPLIGMELEVRRPGYPAYTATMQTTASVLDDVSRFEVGKVIPVRVDPKKPQRVYLDMMQGLSTDNYSGSTQVGAGAGMMLRLRFVLLPMLGILLCVVVMGAGIVGLVMTLLHGAFTSSPAYQKALEAAQADPQVQAALGTPVEAGYFIGGRTSQYDALSGDANLSIPVHGPKGSGTLYVAAREANGVWTFSMLSVHVDGQDQPIVLSP